jgi:2-methylcitrate dehydratase
MDNITSQIAEYASTQSFAQLNDDVVHGATQRLIDALGCGLGAWDCEPAQIGRRLAAGEVPGQYSGRVLFHGGQVSAESAAFINTCMIRNFDFNDRYPGGHPSDTLGALLALAAATEVDGKRVIAAMTVMYEIFTRLCDSARLSHRGWDQGFGVSIAAAAGICNLLRLPIVATANAIGIAASSNMPLRVTRSGELTMWKSVATAYAARNGLFAACLAAEGMAGPGHAFAGRAGLFENVTGPFTLAAFPTEGGASLIPNIELKYWPVEANGQPVVWAALELRKGFAIPDIRTIEFFVSKFAWYEIGSEPEKWNPRTRETADHSLPYIFARTFVDGTISTGSFAEDKVRDPELRPLMAKIKVTVDDAIEAMLPKVVLRVVITKTDGRQHSIEVVNPLGHPDNPMQDNDIADKFTAMAAPVLGPEQCRQALDSWWAVRDAEDIGALVGLLDLPRSTTRRPAELLQGRRAPS